MDHYEVHRTNGAENANEQPPSQEEYKRAQALLAELQEFSKKSWFKVLTEGIILGPTRIMQEGVKRVTGQSQDKEVH